MFTGIIQAVGNIQTVTPVNDDVRLTIQAVQLALADVHIGDSIAVNGICLTAIDITDSHFEAHVSKETLNVTVGLTSTGPVNLEKALRLNDRLGGHLVSGHVDGVGVVVQFNELSDAKDKCWLLAIQAPHAVSKYIAKKGSICVNGVSLTVNSIVGDVFSMNIIPHTMQHTMFDALTIGSLVNLEIDQIARYVERMAEWATESAD